MLRVAKLATSFCCASRCDIGDTFLLLCFMLRYWPHLFVFVLQVTTVARHRVIVLQVTILSTPFRSCASGYDSDHTILFFVCASGNDSDHLTVVVDFRL